MLFRWFYIVLYCVISTFIYAQEKRLTLDTSNLITLQTDALFFIKNNEYKGEFSKGFTGIGVIFKPQVQFHIDPKFSFSAGYYFLKYSGLNTFTDAIPLLSLRYQWTDHITLSLGAINGNLSHDLDQAHYQIDQYYQSHVEYGFQLQVNSQILRSELWLDWQQFIQREDPFPEEFIVGFKSKIRIFNKSPLQLFIDNENLISHIGGEIDVSNEGLQTTWNTSLGLQAKFHKWMLTVGYFYFTLSQNGNNSTTKRQLPFQNGSGYKVGLGYNGNRWSTHISYWSAHDYFSPMGESLLFSVSEFDPNIYVPDRKLLLHDASFLLVDNKRYDISFYLNNYFDLDQSKISTSLEIRANIDLTYKFSGIQLKSI